MSNITCPNELAPQTICTSSSSFATRSPFWILLIILVFGAILRILAFSGYIAGDDFNYIARSFQIADGRFEESSRHWDLRLGVVLPTAFLFNVLGPSLFGAYAIPFLMSLSCIPLAYFLGLQVYQDPKVSLLGAAIVAMFPLDVIMATHLFPDMGIAFCSVAALYVFILAEKRNSNQLYFLAGLLVGLAYLQRETGLYVLLPAAIYIAYTWRWRSGYLLIALAIALTIIGEMVIFTASGASPFSRLSAFADISGGNPTSYWTFYPRPGNKLTQPLLSLATEQEFGLFYLYVFAAIIGLMWLKDVKSQVLLLYLIPMSLYILWGTTSLTRYQPAEPWPRYMSPVTIPAALLVAYWLLHYVTIVWRKLLIGLLVFSSLVCIYLDTSRLYRSLGEKLVAYGAIHSNEKIVMSGTPYMSYFISKGFELPYGVIAIFPQGGSQNAMMVDPNLTVQKSAEEIANCLVMLPTYSTVEIPKTWAKQETILKDRRWFAEPLESFGGIFSKLAGKLSPKEGVNVYRVP